MIRVGIDVGGTFTDAVFFDETKGSIEVRKVPSTPGNQQIGVLNAIEAYGCDPSEISHFLHGTTVATNAVIEKKGAKVGLITTKGFRDILKIRRTTRGKLYDLQWDPPEELVERRFRVEVDERMDAFGTPLKPLNREEVLAQADFLLSSGIETIAVCFLNSYVNPMHEEMAMDIIKAKYPDLYVTASSELLREWREFERTSTTVVAAYVGPMLDHYLSSLSNQIREKGYRNDVLVMLSNGGVAPAFPVNPIAPKTLLSGPAAAAISMKDMGQKIGEDSIISIDIGGTSTDIAIVHEGELLTRSEQEVEFGTVVHLPSIDVATIGAGGGTLASIDKGGMLVMGPESAGAVPGPVCYNKGGMKVTLTDANVLLGRLNQKHLLGGLFPIKADLAKQGIQAQVADRLGLDVYEAASGMIEIVNQNICNAIRRLTLGSGLDVRDYALFACGGGGALQAVEVAKELGMKKVIVPRYPGITAAMGLLVSDVRYDYVESYIVELLTIHPASVNERFGGLADKARNDLGKIGFAAERLKLEYAMDLRYLSQTHELTIAINPEDIGEGWAKIRQKFKDTHEQVFGYSADLEEPLELVNIRITGYGLLDKPNWKVNETAPGTDPQPIETRMVYYKKYKFAVTPIYQRESLPIGWKQSGPAIVEQMDTTTFITPDDSFFIDRQGNLIIEWSGEK